MLNGQMANVRHDGSRSHEIIKDTDVLTLKLWMIAMFRITLAKSFQFTALWFVSNPKLSAMTYNRIETIFSIAMHTLQKLTWCTCWPCMYINVNWDFEGFEVLAFADWPWFNFFDGFGMILFSLNKIKKILLPDIKLFSPVSVSIDIWICVWVYGITQNDGCLLHKTL